MGSVHEENSREAPAPNQLLLDALKARFTAVLDQRINQQFGNMRADMKRVVSEKPRRSHDHSASEPYFNNSSRTYTSRSSTWSKPHKTSQSMVHFSSAYHQPANKIQLYSFSGNSSYLEWERNMEDWFYCDCIPEEKRLPYAVRQLTGKAYQLWVKEQDDRSFYNEQTITTWKGLKKLLRDQYAPKHRDHYEQKSVEKAKHLQDKIRKQRLYEEVEKQVLEAFNSVKTSQKKSPATLQSSSYSQKPLEAKCDLPLSQSDFIKLTPLEPVQPSSIISVPQVLQEESQEESPAEQQRSTSLVSNWEQPTINLKHASTVHNKPIQPELSSHPIEPQKQHIQDKSSNTLKLIEVSCYKGLNRAHHAIECPIKIATNPTSLGLKGNNVNGFVSYVHSSSIFHLSRSKGIDAGSVSGEDHLEKELDIQRNLMEEEE